MVPRSQRLRQQQQQSSRLSPLLPDRPVCAAGVWARPKFRMRVLCFAVLVTALVIAVAAKQRVRKFDGDFEFAEEVSEASGRSAHSSGVRQLLPSSSS